MLREKYASCFYISFCFFFSTKDFKDLDEMSQRPPILYECIYPRSHHVLTVLPATFAYLAASPFVTQFFISYLSTCCSV